MNLKNLFSYKEKPVVETKEIKIEKPFKTVTTADSYLYEGYNLTPINPADIVKQKGYEIYDKMLADDQIHAVTNLKKYIILSPDWNIESENEEIVEFITWNLNEYLDEIFTKKLYDILSSMDYGFSLSEKVFAIVDNKIVLSRLFSRAPHTFDFKIDKFGDIEHIIQYTANQELHIDKSKFIHHSYQEDFGNPYGKSELNEGVYRAWKSKDAVIRFWNIYLERHGMPLLHGTYTTGGGSKDDFHKSLKNAQARTVITTPEGYTINPVEAGKGTESYEKAIDKYNLMIARSYLIPDLLGFGGSETSGGSYALGDRQADIFMAGIEFIRQQLEKIITRDIVNPLVQWNFGTSETACFKFRMVDEAKKFEMLKLFLEAWKTGKIPVNFELTKFFLNSVEAPEIQEEEFNKIQEEKKAAADAIQQGINKSEEKPDEKKDGKPVEKLDEKLNTKDYAKSEIKKIKRDFDTMEEKYLAELADIYHLVVNALTDEIKRKKIIERKRFDLINNLSLKHQPKVIRKLKELLNESYKKGQGSVTKKLIVDSDKPLADDEIADWLTNHAIFTATTEAEFILKKVKPALSEGIRNGDSVRDIMTTIDGVLKGYDIGLEANRLETIVRTNISTAYNEGRAKEFVDMGDLIIGYKYNAVLDGRTTDLCQGLNGKIIKPAEMSYYNPPKHFNCRSLLTPVFKGESLKGESPPPTERDKNAGGNFLRLK
ncbi:MAG: DUF935 family protein [PVC group bacterium]|nr:DUF935 family protein [PVC group bacterium]